LGRYQSGEVGEEKVYYRDFLFLLSELAENDLGLVSSTKIPAWIAWKCVTSFPSAIAIILAILSLIDTIFVIDG